MLLRPKAIPSLAFWGLEFLRNSRPSIFRKNTLSNLMLANYSMEVLRCLRSENLISYGANTNGTLKVYRSQSSFKKAIEQIRDLPDDAINFRALRPDAIIELEPTLKSIEDKIVGGLHFPNDEAGDAFEFVKELCNAYVRLGGEIAFDTAVNAIDVRRKKVAGVITNSGTHATETVVVACGAYSLQLLREHGVYFPVKPVKGYSLSIENTEQQHQPRIPVIDDELHAVVTPLPNQIRVAGTAEFSGFDLTPSKKRVENLWLLLAALYPGYAATLNKDDGRVWTGLRPMSATGVPIIGETKISGLFINSGHGHLGWTQAAGSGRALADLITRKSMQIDLTPFKPHVFGRI